MIVRAYGFRVDPAKLPSAMTAFQAFEALAGHGAVPLDNKGILHGTGTLITHNYRNTDENWLVGIILKSRDAKSFSKVVARNGTVTMTAEQLADGKIAESSYFIVHPTTGKGLMATYQGSPSIKVLEWALKKSFVKLQSQLRNAAVSAASGTANKKAAAASFKGVFSVHPMLREGDLKTWMKEFNKVNSVELKISAVAVESRLLGKPQPKTVTRTERYTYPPGYRFDDAHDLEADEIVQVSLIPGCEATIIGTLNGGARERLSSSSDDDKNKEVFGATEYDDLHGEFIFQHTAAGSNIADSPVIMWLRTHINNHRIHTVLTTS